jgi:hypothetical protein
MATKRPEWFGSGKQHSQEKSGPERYARPGRPLREILRDIDRAAANEGETREPVRGDASLVHRQSAEVVANDTATENDLDALLRRLVRASVEEVDRVIRDLDDVRGMLRGEGERVTREIAGYASLTHASMTAMKVISESIKQWKDPPDRSD